MESLGSRVKNLRKRKNLTQIQLGNLVGIHHTNIGRIENKEAIPQADVLYLIAKNLGTSVEWLLTGRLSTEMLNELPIDTTSKTINRFMEELLLLCQQLSDSEQKEIIQFAQFLIYKRSAENT